MRIPGLWRVRKRWSGVKEWHERGVNALAARGVLPPFGAPARHPVLAAFPPQPAAAHGVDTDFLGLRTQAEMLPPYWRSPPAAGVPAPPVFDEEYFEVAVGAEAGETVFLVEMPAGSEGNSPREWYGQAVAWDDPASGAATTRTGRGVAPRGGHPGSSAERPQFG